MVKYQLKKTSLEEEFDLFMWEALRGRLPKRAEEADKEEEKEEENDNKISIFNKLRIRKK
jgi:hypothetical protein